MTLRQRLSTVFERYLAEGLMIRLRHGLPSIRQARRLLRGTRGSILSPRLDERVVVVGLGPAAMACLRELKAEGFTNVQVVAEDRLYGGKCVNLGCMPIEFALHLGNEPVEERAEKVGAFVASLRVDVERQFDAIGYPLHEGRAVEIRGKQLILADGTTLDFDRLILGIGGDFPLPSGMAGADLIDLSTFWTLPPGSDVSVYAEDNPAVLSLGDVAQMLGLKITVLMGGTNPLGHLPSYKYFLRELIRRGVTVHEGVQLRGAKGGDLTFTAKGKTHHHAYRHLLVLSRPKPRFLPIDGVVPGLHDIDLTRSSLPARPDIAFMGDGGGLLTAAEGDLQARLLIRTWRTGKPIDLRLVNRMPFAIHGLRPLAIVGAEWTYVARQWQEIDFRALGWSKTNGLEGKLWYLTDDEKGMVEAVHICHPHAAELACLAAALIRHPVSDPQWLNAAIHPSGAEIFHLVADQAFRAWAARHPAEMPSVAQGMQEYCFAAPALDELTSDFLPDWLDHATYQRIVLSPRPAQDLAVYSGLAKLAQMTGLKPYDAWQRTPDGYRVATDAEVIDIATNAPGYSCIVKAAGISIKIIEAT